MQRISFFPTHVDLAHPTALESVTPRLRDRFLAERRASPGIRASQDGGWHSVPDLTLRDDPDLRVLFDEIVALATSRVHALAGERGGAPPRLRWSVQAWSVVLEPGGLHVVHDHADAHLAAVFYVDAGDGGDTGALCLVDPRRATTRIPGLDLDPSTARIAPETGLLVVFPGSVQHYVEVYRGTRPRIAVSANLRGQLLPAR